jgi:hypothetical protein
MESVNINLKEIPSVRTWAHKKEPKTAIEFQEKLSRLGDEVVVIIKNKKNPSYSKYFKGAPKEVHQEIYDVKLKVGATEPNRYTQGLIPKKNTKRFIKNPRQTANSDYEVTFMSAKDKTEIQYKFNEDKIIQELQEYINSTYDQHYSKNNFQATEFIIDGGHGTGFCIGNVLKYAQRYGKKGTPADARKDLMKVLHYATIAINIHDQEHKDQ